MRYVVGILMGILVSGWMSISAQPTDCRLDINKLKPVIHRYNPFFTDHKWDSLTRIESARISNTRYVVITQGGCIRHHINMEMSMDPREVKKDKNFWPDQVKRFMYMIHFEDKSYPIYRAQFEEGFALQFFRKGINESFNFPIGTRNFICQILYTAGKEARISIEQIEYVFKEKVLR
ncbi:MAG: hypothetical protein AAF824_08970 [Bacteroidota bacterium]